MTSKTEKVLKTTTIKSSDMEVWSEDEEAFVMVYPTNFFYVNSLGDYIFIHTRDRKVAQNYIDDYFGKKGFYTVRQAKESSGSGDYSAVGTATRQVKKS